MRQALGLRSVPDFTTLYRFLQGLDDLAIAAPLNLFADGWQTIHFRNGSIIAI
jgi:hypothetical protein